MAIQSLEWINAIVGDGRYEVLSRLGEGSMGIVYRAFDNRLETEVVLKVPRIVTLEDPEYRERFRREIHSLAKLSHPHIVKIIDVGEQDGFPFCVMQYLAGGSLKSRLYPGTGEIPVPMSVESLHDWLIPVAKALDFVHSQGYLHRDVKPANILFDEHSNAFLSDFGLAKVMQTDSDRSQNEGSLTAAGFLVGTANYVAPEIVMGLSTDGRIDQYSLAMTVYEMLTGRVPLEGSTASATLVHQTSKPVPPLQSQIPGVSEHLAAAIHKALAKKAPQRFATCLEFVDAAFGNSDRELGSTGTHFYRAKESANTARCPTCRRILPLREEFIGRRVRCGNCEALLRVESDGVTLSIIEPGNVNDSPTTTNLRQRGKIESESGGEAPTQSKTNASRETTKVPNKTLAESPTPLPLGGEPKPKKAENPLVTYAVLAGVILLALFAGGYLFRDNTPRVVAPPLISREDDQGPTGIKKVPTTPPVVGSEFRIVAGPAKKAWLDSVLATFKAEALPASTQLKLDYRGDIDAAEAFAKGELTAQVWIPDSSWMHDWVDEQWQAKHPNTRFIEKSSSLAFSTPVLLMWKARADEFSKAYPMPSLSNVCALKTHVAGWGSIMAGGSWGAFRVTMPSPRNDICAAATLMAALRELHVDPSTPQAEITAPMRNRINDLRRNSVAEQVSGRDIVSLLTQGGISYADCVLVAESDAVAKMEGSFQSKHGSLQILYPDPAVQFDHPVCVLNSGGKLEQKVIADKLFDYLKSDHCQSQLINFGLRPVATIGESIPAFDSLSRYGYLSVLPPSAQKPTADWVRAVAAP